MNIPSCRVCGCTDWNPCFETDGFPCCWVEQNLCSACAFSAQNGRVELLEEGVHFAGKEDVS